ncbi:hypothetical protein [Dactylococcopsis salina]|uniref:hypothetical protein n=1 Tax=Dactylococcopsis salina TaxID=292566 RepID=UPI00059B9C08|nr:hypothetical protein [Dactylococcopsis salina]
MISSFVARSRPELKFLPNSIAHPTLNSDRAPSPNPIAHSPSNPIAPPPENLDRTPSPNLDVAKRPPFLPRAADS